MTASPTRLSTVLRTAAVVAVVVAALAVRSGHNPWSNGADPDDPTAYNFSRTHPTTHRPITWDPCLPIDLVVNHAAAPEGADALLSEAVARVSEATGLRLVVQGPVYVVQQGPPTSELAVVSLIASLVWLCGIGSVIALVCGIAALSQTKSGARGGHGLAVPASSSGHWGCSQQP